MAGHPNPPDAPDQIDESPLEGLRSRYGRGELAYQVTADGAPVFPPRLVAPGTGGPLEWRVSSGSGTVYATTVLRGREEPPRNLALIDLEEGFRMMSEVVGVEPEEVCVGMAVAVEFDAEAVPRFRPR
ncbi:MAG: OB-fold domain-containing protein [Solirubrobacterales bacterium]